MTDVRVLRWDETTWGRLPTARGLQSLRSPCKFVASWWASWIQQTRQKVLLILNFQVNLLHVMKDWRVSPDNAL